jgi:phytoene dehydrogenase-like protein
MSNTYDVVVMGGGQNTLGAAAYLAKAGKKVAVLERHAHLGGGAVTLERTAPGFLHDKHSALHILIQANPLVQNDELGLLSKFGLQYVYPDVATATVLEDYSALPFYFDLDRTCEAIAQFSQKDAQSYRELALFARRMLPMVLAGMFNVPIPMSGLLGILEQSEDGRRMIDFMLRSPLQIVNELFESDHVRIHMIKSCSEHALVYPDDMGTGLCVLFLTVFLHIYKLGLPVGGSGALATALARCIEHHGGVIVRNCEVSKVVTRGGRAVGVRTIAGEEYHARDAVVASIHPKRLGEFVDGVPETILARAGRTQHSGYRLLKVDAALREPLHKNVPDHIGQGAMVDWVFARDLREFLQSFDPLRHGMVCNERPLIGGGDMQPPDRTPAGKSMLYMVRYSPYDLADGGPQKWDAIKETVVDELFERCTHFMPNLTSENVIARVVDSPLDMERYSPNSMMTGDVMGLGFQFFQMAGYRPMPELAQFAVPGVERLYLCGPFMHPGGGVFGIGRPTAIKVCDDLGIDFDKMVAR